ncbi:hypothetical protein KV100_06890 [Mumia sp. zg.B21]|uniref:hypothetical protein n=1 Tax=Mumia sp. zg.B21 TaxID=2855447 RepID=UPI001C6DD85D|nr:hypothetical protein [Mumia sp. zg.B21]MBW9209376.1 hypothetical protein [Mumia sp. zg.B21]
MSEQSTTPDPIMQRIAVAMSLGQRDDRDGARAALREVWDELGEDGDSFHRCVVAHFLADVTADAEEELVWDLRALAAARETSDERAKAHHASLTIAGFFPSLHLNLADVLRRLGRFDEAAEHAESASARIDVLPEDDYGTGLHEALVEVTAMITARDTTARDSAPGA